MSELNVATTAEILASDTGLPFTVVPWTPPLVGTSRPSVSLRRAMAALEEHGGGLLVAQVVRDAVGRPASPGAARTALATALRDARVAEFHAVRCTDGIAVVARLLPEPVVHVPSDLIPLEGADSFELRPSAAEQVASIVTRRALAAVDEDVDVNTRLLVAAGALAMVDDEPVPTVAGLVAFGRAPWERLGGLRVQVVDDGRELVVVGDGPSLPQRVVRALRVREPNAVIVRALVERGLIERAWSPYAEDEPIVVVRKGSEIEVRWPEADGDEGIPNRTLRRLLHAAGGLGRLALDSVRIKDRVEARGGEWGGEERDGCDVVVRVVLPEEIADPHPDQVEPVASVPNPVAPPAAAQSHEVPVRDRVVVPSQVMAPTPSSPPAVVAAPAPAVVVRAAPPAAPLPSVAVPPTPIGTTDREGALLALLDARGRVTSRDVIDGLGWTRSTTRDVIARIVATGLIVGVAASARSPFQAYVRA